MAKEYGNISAKNLCSSATIITDPAKNLFNSEIITSDPAKKKFPVQETQKEVKNLSELQNICKCLITYQNHIDP
ncbi:hypothetical protein MTBBW1_120035 [Desulfamplus magnetovallimortis]|uniref:Uncharacterized protein n=1 Tax=Desulfamplus magnetovallimortis TaxID=1246637 RepID=A0A1W1H650_9BACT|nr:hypothetical protein MTBBW1_120035 [Desulfamplus magnetovallimortis]